MKDEKRNKEKMKKKDTSQKERTVEYSSLDACVCCGRYMPEGTGMVCEECLKQYDK